MSYYTNHVGSGPVPARFERERALLDEFHTSPEVSRKTPTAAAARSSPTGNGHPNGYAHGGRRVPGVAVAVNHKRKRDGDPDGVAAAEMETVRPFKKPATHPDGMVTQFGAGADERVNGAAQHDDVAALEKRANSSARGIDDAHATSTVSGSVPPPPSVGAAPLDLVQQLGAVTGVAELEAMVGKAFLLPRAGGRRAGRNVQALFCFTATHADLLRSFLSPVLGRSTEPSETGARGTDGRAFAELHAICGATGSGKSWALVLLEHAAKARGWPVIRLEEIDKMEGPDPLSRAVGRQRGGAAAKLNTTGNDASPAAPLSDRQVVTWINGLYAEAGARVLLLIDDEHTTATSQRAYLQEVVQQLKSHVYVALSAAVPWHARDRSRLEGWHKMPLGAAVELHVMALLDRESTAQFTRKMIARREEAAKQPPLLDAASANASDMDTLLFELTGGRFQLMDAVAEHVVRERRSHPLIGARHVFDTVQRELIRVAKQAVFPYRGARETVLQAEGSSSTQGETPAAARAEKSQEPAQAVDAAAEYWNELPKRAHARILTAAAPITEAGWDLFVDDDILVTRDGFVVPGSRGACIAIAQCYRPPTESAETRKDAPAVLRRLWFARLMRAGVMKVPLVDPTGEGPTLISLHQLTQLGTICRPLATGVPDVKYTYPAQSVWAPVTAFAMDAEAFLWEAVIYRVSFSMEEAREANGAAHVAREITTHRLDFFMFGPMAASGTPLEEALEKLGQRAKMAVVGVPNAPDESPAAHVIRKLTGLHCETGLADGALRAQVVGAASTAAEHQLAERETVVVRWFALSDVRESPLTVALKKLQSTGTVPTNLGLVAGEVLRDVLDV